MRFFDCRIFPFYLACNIIVARLICLPASCRNDNDAEAAVTADFRLIEMRLPQ